MAYLQVLTLNSNRVSSLSGLKQPSLECLELNDNVISHLIQNPDENFDGEYCSEIDCPNLSTLALSRNALETIEQFMFVSIKLRVLYLSYNKIDKLKGLEHLSNLSHLHLRGNQISSLDGFTDNLKHLSYLNLRENLLHDMDELTKLVCLKSLKTLVVSHNSFRKNPRSIAKKVLKLLPWLERIDKGTVSTVQSDNGVKGSQVYSDSGESGQDEDEGSYEEK
uniref:Leucine-rich repeat-containing protein 23 n=1 Tax=Sipha flava TaxID=143950 RepID=A0A2S2R7F7_9HEMI